MPKTPADIRSLCRAFTAETVQIVAGIARTSATPPGVRVAAIGMLWDRGWGKAPQSHTGADGEGDIRFTIRHIIEGRDSAHALAPGNGKVLEHVPIDSSPGDDENDAK